MVLRKALAMILCLCVLSPPCYGVETTWQEEREAGSKAYRQAKYDDAARHFEAALKNVDNGGAETDIASCCAWLASSYDNQGRYAEAEPLHKRALDIREKKLGADHPDVATSLNNLALLYYNQGRYAEAEPLYKRALAVYEKAHGPDHPNVATSLNGLALLYDNRGRYAEAEPLYKRALEICEKVHGAGHPDVATSVNNLALLYYNQGRYAEAEPLYKRALEIYEKVQGADHPGVATLMNNLTALCVKQGRYAEAEPLCKRALAIQEKKLGADHPAVATSLNGLALLYDNQGRYVEAEPLYERALAIREKKLSADHPDIALSLNNLAGLYDNQGRYAEAEPLYKRALAIREKKLGADHAAVATSLNSLAFLYKNQGRYTEAEPLYKRAVAVYEKAHGPNHPNVAAFLNNLAVVYKDQGRYAEAEPLYKRALAIWEKRLGARREIDPFARRAQIQRFYLIASLHEMTGSKCEDLELALLEKLQSESGSNVMKEFDQLLSARRKLAGEDDPQTAETLMQIGIAFKTMGGSSKDIALKAFGPLSTFSKKLLSDTTSSARTQRSSSDSASFEAAITRIGGIEKAKSFAALSLMCLANMLADESEDAQAKEAFKLSEACFLVQSNPKISQLVVNLLELSDSWLNLGDFAKCKELIARSSILAKNSSDLSLQYKCKLASANLALEQAGYSSAIELADEALSAGKQSLEFGKLSGECSLCDCYKILSEASAALGKFEDAKKFASDALALKDLSKQDRAYCLVLLGEAQSELKQLNDARKSLEEAFALSDRDDKTLSQSTFTQAKSSLGHVLAWSGDHKGALNNFGWALSWDQNNPSSDGLLATARDYNGLAMVETALVAAKNQDGDADRARYYALEGSQRIDKYIKTAFYGLSIAQQCAFLAVAKQQRDALLSACQNKDSIGPAYGLMMKWKGLLLESLRYKAAIKTAVANNPALAKKQEELDAKIKILSGIANKSDDTASGGDRINRERKESAERDRLEQELSAAAGVTLEDPLQKIGADAFRNLLKSDEAFVDVVSYKPFLQDDERYAAIAMKSGPDGGPIFIDLGKKSEIDEVVRKWRYGTTGIKSELERDVVEIKTKVPSVSEREYSDLTQRLSSLIITNTKLQDYFGTSIKRLWICPEGELGRVPWNAIATIGGATERIISEVDSPREFAFLRAESGKLASRNEKILLAGLSDFSKAGLPPLNGALQEVNQIKSLAEKLHRQFEYLPEEKATKESVKKNLTTVASAHLATHGFASGGSTGGGDDRGTRAVRMTMRAGGGTKLAGARNPLSECGLYLAYPLQDVSSNEVSKSDEAENILTADEIIGLDLSKCEIVTLSACQTGLGRQLNGQGVIGLRSAILGAGAKSVLLSLWSVPDDATRELMKRFYSNLWEKNLPKRDALADAQEYIREQPKWKAPKNWAAWVLVGE